MERDLLSRCKKVRCCYNYLAVVVPFRVWTVDVMT